MQRKTLINFYAKKIDNTYYFTLCRFFPELFILKRIIANLYPAANDWIVPMIVLKRIYNADNWNNNCHNTEDN